MNQALAQTRQFPLRPGTRRVALVLQGGGALGAYQVGVFQALDERGFTPDWVGGTSIGAINGAIIAGNPRGHDGVLSVIAASTTRCTATFDHSISAIVLSNSTSARRPSRSR